MTTAVTTGFFQHTSTATFQAWGSEFSGALATIGLTQTSDTGQINWSTVTYTSSTSTVQGYEIWRFNDTLQSTTPIFIKIEYGTGGTSGRIGLWTTVGKGSDGAGNITGVLLSRAVSSVGDDIASYVTTYVSNFCYNATYGFLGICFKKNANASGENGVFIFIGRTTDQSSGATTNVGIWRIISQYTGTGLVANSTNYANPSLTFTIGTGFLSIPGGLTSTIVAGAAQIFRIAFPYPQVLQASQVFVGSRFEFPDGGTMTLSPYGTPLTYIALNSGQVGWTDSLQATSINAHCPIMLWQ